MFTVDNNKKEVDDEIKKFAKFLTSTSIEELRENFEGDEDYMSAINKIEELFNDPDFVREYNLAEKNRLENEYK